MPDPHNPPPPPPPPPHSEELFPCFGPDRRSAAEPQLPGERRLQQAAVDQLHPTSQRGRGADRRPAAGGRAAGTRADGTRAGGTRAGGTRADGAARGDGDGAGFKRSLLG